MTLTEAIEALGERPEQVSEVLRAKGIKGSRCSASRCPIARYLNACGFPDVTVSTHVNRYSSSTIKEEIHECIPLNWGVQDWICQFDDGKHPEFYEE